MSYENNPFYSPESFDPPLEIVASVSLNDDPYEFHYLVLWRVKGTQDYYAAADSGCSCPTPFEDFSTLADLTPVGVRHLEVTIPGTSYPHVKRTAFRKLVETAEASQRSDQDRFWGVPPEATQVADFIKIVRQAEAAYRAK